MPRLARLWSITWLLALFAATPLLRAEEAGPVTTATPSGEYATAWLQLAGGGPPLEGKAKAGIDVALFVGFRGATAATVWFAHPSLTGSRMVWLDASTLTLRNGKLQGQFSGRTSLNWGDKTVHDYRYQIDALVAADRNVAGAFTALFSTDAGQRLELGGKLTGRVTESGAADNRLAVGQNWPHYYGAGTCFAAPASAAQLIDQLAQARPVWKSEAFIPTAYGSAPDSRYFDRAGRTNSGGGSSSPVVVDGRVYQFYYYPRGPVGLDRAYAKYETEADLQAIAEQLFPHRAIEQQAVVNHFRTQADEVLVCLDAATGQTLWQTTFPRRGNNYQTHKHRGHFPVALVANGVVYQPGTTGRLYAVEAASGKLLWEYPDAQPEAHTTKQGGIDCHAPSPILLDGVVAYAARGKVTGVDAKTGARRWEQPLWHRSSLLAVAGERPLILASDRQHETRQNFAVALNPADGAIVWRQEVPYLLDYAFPLLARDLLLGYSLQKVAGAQPGENDGLAILHAYRVTPAGLQPAWTTAPLAPIIDTIGLTADRERAYLSAAREVLALNLENGQVVSRVENVGGARTQTLMLAGERLFLQPEGRHGKQSFFQLSTRDGALRVLAAGQEGSGASHPVGAEDQWRPPHSWTTAYANQPIVYPLVDGRLFVRGLDAMYCYDLRQR